MDWILGRLEARVTDLGHLLFLSRVTVSSSFIFSSFSHAQGFTCEPLSFSTSHHSLARAFSFIWLLDKSSLPLGYKANAQLSRLSQRHVEKRGLTPSYSVLWRTTNGTNNTLLRDEYFPRKMLISPNFSISESRAYSLGWVSCLWSLFWSQFSQPWCKLFTRGRFITWVT